MMEFIYDLALFGAKSLFFIIVAAIVLVIVIKVIKGIAEIEHKDDDLALTLENYKDKLESEKDLLSEMLVSSNREEAKAYKKAMIKIKKAEAKAQKQAAKALSKKMVDEAMVKLQNQTNATNSAEEASTTTPSEQNSSTAEPQSTEVASVEPEMHKKVLFIYDFRGSTDAKEVEHLRRVITLILSVAEKDDEVVIRLTSPGGTVNGYGLCAAELERLKAKNITLTIAVDEVAASGGYMMACVGSKIIAAPFAYIGSIGVVAEFPNFNRLMKKYDVDYEQVTAGEFKRTLTPFGENTDEAREKFKEELQRIHVQFKEHVKSHRPNVDIEKIATGEHWLAKEALDLGLVDELKTSDEYISERIENVDMAVTVAYKSKKKKNLFGFLHDKSQLADFCVLLLKRVSNLKNKVNY